MRSLDKKTNKAGDEALTERRVEDQEVLNMGDQGSGSEGTWRECVWVRQQTCSQGRSREGRKEWGCNPLRMTGQRGPYKRRTEMTQCSNGKVK